MNPQRYHQIKTQALALRAQLRAPVLKTYEKMRFVPDPDKAPDPKNGTLVGTGEYRTFRFPARDWLRRQQFIRVTLDEHRWLCQNRPNVAKFTRVFEYHDTDYFNDPQMESSRPPKVMEIWVGARSLKTVALENDEDTSDSAKRAMEIENAAELTALQTMLYHDARTGQPMIVDDETGEYRPVRNGDVISIVRGSNDDLDALFLDEPDDPRQQNDFDAAGTDHKWSDRFQANSGVDEAFLEFEANHHLPNNHPVCREVIVPPDDFFFRSKAQRLVAAAIQKNPALEPQLLKLTDEVEQRLRDEYAPVRFEHGELTHGYFVDRREYYAEMEKHYLKTQRCKPKERPVMLKLPSGDKVAGFTPKAQPPLPVDWELLKKSAPPPAPKPPLNPPWRGKRARPRDASGHFVRC
jgi:hypothetical protein